MLRAFETWRSSRPQSTLCCKDGIYSNCMFGTCSIETVGFASDTVDLVAVLPVLEWVGTIRPVHLRHAEAAVEEVGRHQRAKIQSIGRLRMPPNGDPPPRIEHRHVLGSNGKLSLCLPQAAWPEVDWSAGRLRRGHP